MGKDRIDIAKDIEDWAFTIRGMLSPGYNPREIIVNRVRTLEAAVVRAGDLEQGLKDRVEGILEEAIAVYVRDEDRIGTADLLRSAARELRRAGS